MQEETTTEISCSPPRLGIRFLPTIPSAADSSVVMDEDSAQEANGADRSVGAPFYTVLQDGGRHGSSNTLSTLSSPKANSLKKPP